MKRYMPERERVKMQADYEINEQPIEDTLGPGAGQLEKEITALEAEIESTADPRAQQALERRCQDLRAQIQTSRIHVRRDLVEEELRERRRRRGEGTPAEIMDRLMQEHPLSFHFESEYLRNPAVQRELENRKRGIRPGGGRMV